MDGDGFDNNRRGFNDRVPFNKNGGPPGAGGFRGGRNNDFPAPQRASEMRQSKYDEENPPLSSAAAGAPPPQSSSNIVPARFKKMSLGGMPSSPSGLNPFTSAKDAEVSLRPQLTNNMLFKPKTPSMLPKSALSKNMDGSSPLGENSLLGPPMPNFQPKVMMTPNEPLVIKQASLDKAKNRNGGKGNKGPTREEVFNRMETILAGLLEHQSTNEAVESWRENDWLPSKMNQTAVTHLYKLMLAKDDKEQRELACAFIAQLVRENAINSTHCLEALSKILGQLSDLEKVTPELRVNLADTTSWFIKEKLMTLKEVTELLEGSDATHPVFLLTLQRLVDAIGKDELKDAYDLTLPASGATSLADFVPAEHRSDAALVELLETYSLSFLLPLLIIRQDMAKQLKAEPEPAAFNTWLNGNVDEETKGQAGFVLALFSVVVGHIHARVEELKPEERVEAEKDLLAKFRVVLQPCVRDKPALQLVGVYALQVFCHEKDFPKGLLLRSFVNFYELDIMDEHAFLQWKEDVNESFPGKGKALFQVNQWLTWLEEAESEEEEDDDDE